MLKFSVIHRTEKQRVRDPSKHETTQRVLTLIMKRIKISLKIGFWVFANRLCFGGNFFITQPSNTPDVGKHDKLEREREG